MRGPGIPHDVWTPRHVGGRLTKQRRRELENAAALCVVRAPSRRAPRGTRGSCSVAIIPDASLHRDRPDAADFVRYARTRDPALREALVRRLLPLARQLAGRYAASAEREDLEQVAALGLLNAIERYDPERGIAFSSFAVPTILGDLKRYFRDLGWAVRVPRDLQEVALRIYRVTDELTAELGRSPTAEELARRCG